MAHALFESHTSFRDRMIELDRIAVRYAGHSIVDALYGCAPPDEFLYSTILSHPAIFMVEYCLAQSLIEAGPAPDVVLGVSMGTFAAAVLAGCLDVGDALCAVIEQARSLEHFCEPGTMLAVLGDRSLLADQFISAHSELASVTFESHFVVSALEEDARAIENELQHRATTYQRLPVSFAFHSQWIDPARGAFSSFARSLDWRPARLPIVCCDHVEPRSRLGAGHLWDAVRAPMRFGDAVGKLEAVGTQHYIDVGPSGTLATFLKYILPRNSHSTVQGIVTPFGRETENFAAAVAPAISAGRMAESGPGQSPDRSRKADC